MNILFVSPVAFDALQQRHQALATGLAAEGHTIGYLEPPVSGGFSCRVMQRNERLHTIQTHIPFRATAWPSLQKIASRLVFGLLYRTGLVYPSRMALWIADPAFAAFADLPWLCRFYDRCDRHGVFPGQNVLPWKRYEQALYNVCNVVFASTPILCDEARQGGACKVVLLPNAAHKSWIDTPATRSKPSTPPIRLVSAGAHFEWIDFDWLRLFADDSRCELHIAGPGRGSAFAALAAHRNVKTHGSMRHESLRDLLDECHVGLAPFCRSLLTEAVDPVKVYEYAARRLAVWAVDLPNLRTHCNVDRVITCREDLDHALEEFAWPVSGRHSKIPTWNDRIETIQTIIGDISDQ
ncbi:MAG: hypothetical protein HQM09_15970 [Candidatus Riflebacteria bacterium]|nr:hypothetical protein [Candidatus Riflebacteria bacterium]